MARRMIADFSAQIGRSPSYTIDWG